MLQKWEIVEFLRKIDSYILYECFFYFIWVMPLKHVKNI